MRFASALFLLTPLVVSCQSPEYAAETRAQEEASLAAAIEELNMQLDQLRNEVSLLRTQLQSIELDADWASARADLENMRARRGELSLWLIEARQTMNEEHPQIQEVSAALTALDAEIEAAEQDLR